MYNNEIIQNDLELVVNNVNNLSKLKNKSVLITGATGMLASYYMYTLMYLNDKCNYGITIYALVRNACKLNKMIGERKDVVVLEQDVCNEVNFDGALDYIIHMASSANPKTITSDPVGIINANVIGTLNMLKLAKEKNAKILFTSTREVYGKMADDVSVIKEGDMGILDCIELRSCYPESKKLAENLIVSYAYQYNIKYQIVRIAHSYGPGMIIKDDGRIMSDLIYNVVCGDNIILKSSGEAKRAFCYIVDATIALLLVTLSDSDNEVYNIANETEEISIRDLALSLKEWYSNKNIDVVFDIQENDNRYVKFKRVMLDTSKLENLGWKPLVSLKDGITNTVNYFESIK